MQEAVEIESDKDDDQDNHKNVGKCPGAKRKHALQKNVFNDGEHSRARLWPHFKEDQKDIGTSKLACRSFLRRASWYFHTYLRALTGAFCTPWCPILHLQATFQMLGIYGNIYI